MPKNIFIIGAGLTGLTLAYLLKNTNYKVTILEARNRIGGRIHTLYKDGFAPLEMGATWLGKKHTALVELLEELNLETFPQILGQRAIFEPISTSPPQLVQLPPNNDPSFRIKGGTTKLIHTLANQLDQEQILLNQIVQSIESEDNELTVKTNTASYTADYVVSTLPPFLLQNSIEIKQALPKDFSQIAQNTHTWMGESIKVSLTYAQPFWRSQGLSGTIYSNVGPIPEMYDHTDADDQFFALKGFLNGAYFSLSKDERLALVLRQLRKYFGVKADTYTSYEESVWRKEAFTFAPYQSHVLPHQNNGHPIYQHAYLDGKFFIAGAETAAQFPGYMDGAVRSAKFVFQQLLQNLT